MDKNYADYLIKKTKEDYNTIAGEFDRTREYLWDGMEAFADFVHNGDCVLDFGCGNGRLLELFEGKSIIYTGVDQSGALIEKAKGNYPDARFLTINDPKIPFPDASFDVVFAVAALHHIPSLAKREALLDEFRRLLKPGGTLIITVWNLWQGNYWKLIAKHAIAKLFCRSRFDFKDVLVPWKDARGNILVQRYYHAFTRRELTKLVRRARFSIREECPVNTFNIYLIATKE